MHRDPDWRPFMLSETPWLLQVSEFGDSGITIKMVGEAQPIKQWDVMGELRRRIKRVFDEQVIDRGVGIAQGAMPRIFERLYQTEDTGRVEGLGLGLYISKQILEAHGGPIWATSKVGEGSTFSLTLPLGQAGCDSHTQRGERPLQAEKR